MRWDSFVADAADADFDSTVEMPISVFSTGMERNMFHTPKLGWFRRALLGMIFLGAGVLTLGATAVPASAYYYYPYYYGYPYYYPYYSAYYPHYYGYPYYYGNPAVRVGFGWGWGWRGGWHGGWHRR